ncbi:MAG: hypothetical protein OEL83_03755 [Desulforhopalus sp.]|nr:hypothetical protein [Desulforhopalus sp.]
MKIAKIHDHVLVKTRNIKKTAADFLIMIRTWMQWDISKNGMALATFSDGISKAALGGQFLVRIKIP